MYLFKLHRLLNETTGEPEAGAPKPTLNPRAAAMAQLAQQHNARIAPDFQAFNEDTNEVVPKEPAQEVREQPQERIERIEADARPQEVEPDEPKPRMVSIIVDGQTIEVGEDKILEAGKRTLQKESAADRRLQEANAIYKRLQSMAQQQQPSSDAAHQPAPSSDAQPSKEPASRALDEATLEQTLDIKLYNRDAQRAAKLFEQEFPEIASDPVLRGYAAQLENERLAHSAAVGEPAGDPIDAYRKHGETVRAWLQERTGNKPTVPQDKQERKRTITAVRAVNAEAPKPDAKKPPSREDILEGMRVARQGRPVMRTQRI